MRRSEARLRAVVEATPNAIVLVNAAGSIEMVNAQTESLFGYPREELLGQPVEILIPERFRIHHPGLRSAFFQAPHARPMGAGRDLYARRKDSTEFPVEIGINPIETEHGPMVLSAILDLSARKALEDHLRQVSCELQAENEQRRQAEIDLEKSREDFRYLFQRNPLPMWVYNQRTMQFLEVNQAAISRYGFSREEFLAMTIADIRPPGEMERLRLNLKSSDPRDYDQSPNWKHRSKSGKLIEVDIFSHAMVFEGQAARLVVAVDVTERNAAEVQLRQSQKMEAIGQLTGGVAHDFNNLLTIILGNLEMIAEECPGKATVLDMVQDALASVARGANLTQRLLAFARQQPLEPKIVDLQHLVSNMAALLGRSLGEAIQIRQDLPPGLWKTRIDPSQLENALLNLAVNARDAMPRGGKLTIEGQNVTLDTLYESESAEVKAGDYVMLAVSDTGEGIPKELLDHVLEPFFTTKAVGKGNGLGLSMVYGFVKQSVGHLKIYSELGHGTTIKLYLPRVDGAENNQNAGSARDAIPQSTRGEVILLVEDDATIRKLVQRLLSSLGYQVFEAEDGPSALSALAEIPHIDLLFTDIVLPSGISGVDLATMAQERHPDLKALYMSGYTRNALSGSHDESIHLLSKPFRKDELARAVHQTLNKTSPA